MTYAGGVYTKIKNKADGLKIAGYNNLMEASELYDQDWRVILLINSRLLDEKDIGEHAIVNHSNHWVGLNSLISVSLFGNRQLLQPFKVYSWNALYTVPRWNKPVTLSTALDSYFGFVAGSF